LEEQVRQASAIVRSFSPSWTYWLAETDRSTTVPDWSASMSLE